MSDNRSLRTSFKKQQFVIVVKQDGLISMYPNISDIEMDLGLQYC